MSSGLQVIVDDSSEDFRFSGTEWIVTNLMQLYGGTSRAPRLPVDPQAPQSGTLSLNFEGTAVSFYGTTPSPLASQNVLISIDGQPPYETTIGDGTPLRYGQWYHSPALPDGRHSITVSRVAGASLDYALVSMGQQTALNGRKVLVDNSSPSISYSGSWKQVDQTLQSTIMPSGRPLGNSTHQSWNQGDRITFDFTGTSIAVYGVFSWKNLGVLSATYTLDGVSLSESYIVTTSSPEYINNFGDASNFLYYSADALSGGSHTLNIDITRCNNQTFALDYISYTASSNTSPHIISASSPPSPSPTPASIKNQNPRTSSSPASGIQTVKGIPIEGIIAAGAGGLVLLAILIFLAIFFYRRRHKRHTGRQRLGSDYYDASRPLMSEQHSGMRTLYLRGDSMDSQRTHRFNLSSANNIALPQTSEPAESPENSATTIESFFPRQMVVSPANDVTIFNEPRPVQIAPLSMIHTTSTSSPRGPPLVIPSERRLTPLRRQPSLITTNLSPYNSYAPSPQLISTVSSTLTASSPLIRFDVDIEPPPPVRHSTSTSNASHSLVAPPVIARRNRSASDSAMQAGKTILGPRTPVRRGHSDSPVYNPPRSVSQVTSLQSPLARKPLLTPVPDIESLLGDSRRQSHIIPLSAQLDQALADLLSPGPDSADSERMRRRLSESDIESPRPLSAHSPLSELGHRLTPRRRPSDDDEPPLMTGHITAAFISPSPIRARWASILSRAARPLPSGIPDDVQGPTDDDDLWSDEGPPAYNTLSSRNSGSSQPVRSPRRAIFEATRQ